MFSASSESTVVWPQTVPILLQWCEDNDIRLDPRLEIRCDEANDIAVYAKEKPVPPNTTREPGLRSSLTGIPQQLIRLHIVVAFIHRSSILSARSCSLSGLLEPVLHGPAAQLVLSVALYVEIVKGETSRWFGYLQSLPRSIVPLPIFWDQDLFNVDQANDGKEALQWLHGTEAWRNLSSVESSNTLKSINEYYVQVAEPLLIHYLDNHSPHLSARPTIEGFYRAFSLVSSRAFLVDAFHGLSMVPIADAFNHTRENHVHLETEFNVCAQCGSVYECPHDVDISGAVASRHISSNESVLTSLDSLKEFDSYYEMVSNADIIPGEEVFNTYGETLSNSQLLAQYGFILDINEDDRVSWNLDEALIVYTDVFGGLHPSLCDWESYLEAVILRSRQIGFHDRFAESGLIFRQDEDDSRMCIDSDGRISHRLWTLLALPLCLRPDREDIRAQLDHATANLQTLLNFQLLVEGGHELDVDEAEACQITNSKQESKMLASLVSLVTRLCTLRKSTLGKKMLPGFDDLNDILDDVPTDMHHTRDSLTLVIIERSILDSCVSAWEELL